MQMPDDEGVQMGSARWDADFIKNAAKPDKERNDGYEKAESYYDGEQSTKLIERAKQFLEACGYKFCDNFIESIVDTLVARLVIAGFDGKDDATTEWAIDTWDANRMMEEQTTVHHNALLLGDAFVIADWSTDDGYAVLSYNDPRMMKVEYDPQDKRKLLWASKRWMTDREGPLNPNGETVERLNLYADDRVEKYFRTQENGVWTVWMDEEDKEWPVSLLRADGTPRGIPVFHFRNRARGKTYGRSEVRSYLGMQDFINKCMVDLALVMDAMAWPQRWASGVAQGDAEKLKIVPGEVWTTESEMAKFGEFKAAEAKPLLDTVLTAVQHLAGTSKTPMHQLVATSGDMPSGEALMTAEAGLAMKAEDRTVSFGAVWEDVMAYCLLLEDDFGAAPKQKDSTDSAVKKAAKAVISIFKRGKRQKVMRGDRTPITVTWRDVESRSGLQELNEAMLKKEIGVSRATILTELGYDPEEEAEKRMDEMQEQAESMQWMSPEYGGVADAATKRESKKDDDEDDKPKPKKNPIGFGS